MSAVPTMKTLLRWFGGHGVEPILGVTAQLVQLLGSGLQPMWANFLADHDDPTGPYLDIWNMLITGAPWTDGILGPLVAWTDHHPDPGQEIRAIADAWRGVDLHELNAFAGPHGGDFLGPFYCELMSRAGQRAKGAFYTPMGVSMMTAAITGPHEEGVTVLDPCCGSGGMLVAAGQVMRADGLDPTTCIWVANDIDPMAVALCAVNLTTRAMGPGIWLSVGNGLLIGSGRPDDPHVTHPPWWEKEDPPEPRAVDPLVEQVAQALTYTSPPVLSDRGLLLSRGGAHARTLGNRRGLPDTDLAPPGESGPA